MSFQIKINGKAIEVNEGMSVLAAALGAGIEIPHLCYDPKLSPGTNCGLCYVSINGAAPVKACETFVAEGMDIVVRSEAADALRKEALAKLLEEHRGDCVAPCTKACPAHSNCQGYAGLIAEGHFKEALKLLKTSYPIPASLGRVCPHPCEEACRRSLFEGPVNLSALKRFAGDMDLSKESPYMPEIAEETGKKVAIIGSGPAGLTAAWLLRIKGHEVTVFEQMPKAGGMLRYGIPEFRLPKAVLDSEIAIIEKAGVKFEYDRKICPKCFEEIKKDFDAVFVSIGAWKESLLGIPGEDLPQVKSGLEVLRDTVLGKEVVLGKSVAISGGGNTAIDSARTALRTPGVEKVTLIYRRDRDQMPAFKEEVDEAAEEGVEFKFLANPIEVKANGDGIVLTLQKMELGEPDESGRRKCVAIEGATEEFACDSLIAAIGQKPEDFADFEKNRRGAFDTNAAMKFNGNVYVGGDAANNGPGKAVEAIADAQKAAAAIDCFLNGKDEVLLEKMYAEQTDLTKEDFPWAEAADRNVGAMMDPADRKNNFKECASTLTVEQAMAEGKRCLECGCLDYYECKLVEAANEFGVPFKNDMSVEKQEQDRRQPFIFRDPNKCIACGKCVRVCREIIGFGCWEEIEENGKKTIRIKDGKTLPENFCISCACCVNECPVGALTERNPHLKSVPLPPEVTDSVCNYCGLACKVKVSHYGDKPLKVNPVWGGNIGTNTLCSHGRLGWQIAMGDRDLTTPLIRKDGELVPASFGDAYADGLKNIKAIQDKYGKDSVGVLIADRMTNEETYSALRMAKALGTDSIYSANIYNGGVEEVFGFDGSTNAYQELSGTQCVFCVAVDVPSYYAMLALPIQEAKFVHGAKLLVAAADGWNGFNFIADRRGVMEDDTRFMKEVVKDCIDNGCVPENAVGFEELKASLANVVPGEEAKAFAKDYREAETGMLIIDRERCSKETARLVCELAVICGKIGRPNCGVIQLLQHNSTQIISLMNIRKNINKLNADVKEGKLKALVLVEQYLPLDQNFQQDYSIINELEYVMLLDSARDPAFEYANVFLPMPGYGAYNGTYLSAEGRFQKVNQSFTIPSGVDGWKILDELCGLFGGKELGSLEAIQEEMGKEFEFLAPCLAGKEFIVDGPIRYRNGVYATDDKKAHLFPAAEKSVAFGGMCFADVALTVWFGELLKYGILSVD